MILPSVENKAQKQPPKEDQQKVQHDPKQVTALLDESTVHKVHAVVRKKRERKEGRSAKRDTPFFLRPPMPHTISKLRSKTGVHTSAKSGWESAVGGTRTPAWYPAGALFPADMHRGKSSSSRHTKQSEGMKSE